MSPAAAHSQGTPPGDEELAALYNQVLNAFKDEPSPTSEHSSHKLPSPGEREYERAYNQYVDNGGDTSRSMQAKTARPTQPAPSSIGLPSSPRNLPTPVTTSPTQGRPVRRLPPIPGQASPMPPPISGQASPMLPPPPPPPPPPSFPVPETYDPDAIYKQKHDSYDSGRRLPYTPPQLAANGNGTANGHTSQYKGLPAEPRLPRQLPSTSRPSTADGVPHISMPLPTFGQPASGDWGSLTDNASVSRHPSTHSASRSSYGYEDPPPRSPSSLDDMYASPGDLGSPASASDSLKPGYSSPENLLRTQSANALAPTPPSVYPGSSYNLGRSPSSGSSQPGLGRNDSNVTTTTLDSSRSSSMYPDNDTLMFRSTSSAATSIGRGNSATSYGSRSDYNDWAPPPPAKYEVTPAVDNSYLQSQPGPSHDPVASSSGRARRENDLLAQWQDIKRPLQLHEGHDEEDYYDDEDPSEDGDDRFFNPALLSHIAVRLRDKVPRGRHVKGSIPYERAFTGKDIVSTIQSQIQRDLLITHGISTNDRRAALQVARSLQSQLFFYEVEWGGKLLQDGVEDVYMFLDDQEGGSDTRMEQEELPTAVVTMLTKCYSVTCDDENPCYSFSCPRKRNALAAIPAQDTEQVEEKDEWASTVPPEFLQTLPKSEINRQNIIYKVISREKQYLRDLDTVETLFIRPLRSARPPIIRPAEIDEFIDEVFHNILDLRECNRRLLEVMFVRQREEAPVIHGIGDIFLDAATEFRLAYPAYLGNIPRAEKRLKEEMEHNVELRRFLEQCARHPDAHRLDLKHFLSRPSEHLQKYPTTLEAICKETTDGNPDIEFLKEAIEAIKKLQTVAQLWTFQTAMNKGPSGKLEWYNLVPEEVRKAMPKKEAKRQSIIFELIKGEMDYVKDLENIDVMYVQPLREMDPPIIPRDRLAQFIHDVFHNFDELHVHHRKMLNTLHEIQREEHPCIRTITAAIYDAVLNFREAYMEYIPHYPIAAYRIDDEMENNFAFKDFVERCTRLPDARKLDMKNFINRPIPRLLRYELLLKGILEETPEGHEDRDTIPQVLEVIKALGKETEPGVVSAKQKVEVWRYNSNLVFKAGETIDMDLLNENRSLIHTGKLLRQPDSGFEWSGWTELFVLLFDNYLVMTKIKESKDREGSIKYQVYRRPIPLDLLTLANFTDPPTQRNTGLLRPRLRGGEKHDPSTPNLNTSPETATDSRAVYPCTIHHNGRLGGLWTVYADSAQARNEWKQKLEEAIGLRKVVQESNKVFEVETLSADTFLVPSILPGANTQGWSHENAYTGKVTCSVPFNTADGRGLVAIGCAEGVWIGFRHDSRSMRRVLHLKMVTQCAMLEDFGIFLVLADKSLFAYHIEALVPSSPQSAHTSQTPQKLSGNKDVHFFSVGNLNGRTLVIYMKKKGLDSVFRVLEPVLGKINERAEAPRTFGSRLGLRSQRSEWFRVYRDFFLPSESFDLIFLKAKIVILCTKGFEIMDLTDFKSVTIPQRDDPRLEKLAKRCESCRPMGMFRSSKDEFLLCYDEFGLYVDRHGDPSRPGDLNKAVQTIEWEGTAEHVAWHPPYVLLFDSRFIEVRHVETGRLAQIISGNDLRCILDGRSAASSSNLPSTPGPEGWSEAVSQEPRVHGVMNSNEPPATTGPNRGPRPVAQHVFELIPTIPLYLPGSLSSPSQSMYFNQSNSPPHSPRLNPALSWRS